MADGARLDIGSVIQETFAVILRHPVVFLGLSFLISGLPSALFQFAMLGVESSFSADQSGFGAQFAGLVTAGFFAIVVSVLLLTLLQAALTVATVRDRRGAAVDTATCLGNALPKALPLIGLFVVLGFAVLFGLALFVVPGVILLLMWFVAVPALVAEDRGVFASLGRSRALTSGSRGMIFAILIAYLVVSLGMNFVAAMGATLSPVLSIGLAAIVDTFTSAISAAGVAVVYLDLRRIKEGPLDEGLAEVFA